MAVAPLATLLMELFSSDELSRFLSEYELAGVPASDAVRNAVAAPTVAPAQYATEVAGALLRRGLVDARLFDALVGVRPGKEAAIRAVASRTAAPSPRPTASREAPPPVANPFAPFACFVGREVELGRVTRLARDGRSSLVVGGRRAGKSALLRQLSEEKLERRKFHLDAGPWHASTEEDVLAGMCAGLGRVGHDREAAIAALEALAPCAVLLDEADRLLERPWTEEFFTWIRWLDDYRFGGLVAFVMAGGPAVARYRNASNGSPVFNTSDYVFVDILDVPARRQLMDRLGRAVDEARLFQTAGGHPWLLNAVLDRMWEGADLEAALNAVRVAGHENFETWRRQLPEDGRALLEAIPVDGLPLDAFTWDGPRSEDTIALITLRCMCLVEVAEGRVFRGPALVLRGWGL